MLNFIGTGSAFNTELGNNSAYYKWKDQILIIDCGSSTFKIIIESNLLDGVKNIHVAITHTHADHVGSLADLILYSYYSHSKLAEKIITVYAPEDTQVDLLLELNGCLESIHYDYHIINHWVDVDNEVGISFVKSSHVAEIPSYSLHIYIEGQELFYSSDVSKLHKHTVKWINDGRFDKVYLDTSGLDYVGNVHLSFRELCEIINPDVRNRVWCMHLDKAFDPIAATKVGFNVAQGIGGL